MTSTSLSVDPAILHDAYVDYALYMLGLRKWNSKDNEFLLDRSKEVLELAHTICHKAMGEGASLGHASSLLLAALSIELGDLNRAEVLLAVAMKSNVPGLEALDDLDGYETDSLSSGDFLVYVMVSLLRSKQGAMIAARRAVRLAVLSFEGFFLNNEQLDFL